MGHYRGCRRGGEKRKNGETSQGSSYFREDFPLSSDRRKMVPRTEIAHTMTYTIIGRRSTGLGRLVFGLRQTVSERAKERARKCLITIGNWFENLIFIDRRAGGSLCIDWRRFKVFADGTAQLETATLTRRWCHAVMRGHEGTEFCSMIWWHE